MHSAPGTGLGIWPGQALRLGLAAGSASLWCSRRWRAPAWTLLGQQQFALQGAPGDFAALGQVLLSLLGAAGRAHWPLSVVLDDALVRLWSVELPHGATCLADIEAAAAMRFQALYGEPAAPWRRSGVWTAGAPFFCAVPEALLAQIVHAADAAKLALVAVVPQFVANWNGWQGKLAAQDWFGQLQGNMLRLGIREQGQLRAVRAIDMPPGASFDWLMQNVQREALLQAVAPPPQLQLCGAVPASWLAAGAGGQFACRQLAPVAPGSTDSALLAQSGSQP